MENHHDVSYVIGKVLFNKFLKDLPNYVPSNKTIPYYFLYLWFSHYRIPKDTARRIILAWCESKFCKVSVYHGIRIDGDSNSKHA